MLITEPKMSVPNIIFYFYQRKTAFFYCW